MLTLLIDLCLKNRFLVLALVGLMAAGGVYSAFQIPIDAVPDMTNVQVQVITDAGSLSPLEVERYITYPVEREMGGLPKVEELRSTSKFGISVVTIVFQEGVDIHQARQWVNERLADARARVAQGYGEPRLGSLSTALGEVLQFEVRGTYHSPMALRTILEWEIAPRVREVPGVTAVNSHGGFYKTFEVRVDPNRLATHRVSLREVLEALPHNNTSAGGGYIVHQDEQRFIRGQALLANAGDIENVVVKTPPGESPVLVRDVANVEIAPLTRQGAATRDGRGEIVTGMAMMLLGENSRTVVHDVKEKLAEIQESLPPGVMIEVIYDRTHLISRTLDTVVHNLAAGGVLVVVVLLLMLGSVRAGLVVSLAIPLSMLFATNMMLATGITASLMSLGAIDFGLLVDSSVIMIENCMRRIASSPRGRSHFEIVRDAAIEVRRPTLFGELIIAVVYLPILALQGTEGKLFRPMALTVLFALAGSLVLSMTLMPVLAYVALPKKLPKKEVWLLRLAKALYRPLVARAVRRPWAAVAMAVLLLATSLPIAWNLGADFMPRLDEGDILIEAVRLPSSTLEGSLEMSTAIENALVKFPEVKTVFCKTGRPEIANDVMGVHQTDVWVMLKPVDEWPRPKTHEQLIEEMSHALDADVPGANFGFTQPIEMRVDELVAGVKADVAVLLYGDDLKTLAAKGKEIEAVLSSIPGAKDVKAEMQANVPTLTIRARPESLARYGVDAQEVLDAVAAIGGKEVGVVHQERARFPIIVRFPQATRENIELLQQVPVAIRSGEPIPLADLADVVPEETPPGIEHESNRRRTYIQCNVRGRDVASFVREAQAEVKERVPLPFGYSLRWGGDFESLQSASLRLAIITPLVLLLIWLLLFTSLGSFRLAALIFVAVPISASGGIMALAARDMPFSISAGVGFIALFGVAVLNGLVWVSGAEHLRLEGFDPRKAALKTAQARLRPVLMTALVAGLGFLPMALSTTAGSEIQRPLASVVIGGLITSTLLTAFVVPAIYPWFAPRAVAQETSIER